MHWKKYKGDLTKCRRIGFQHRVNLVWAKFGHSRQKCANKRAVLQQYVTHEPPPYLSRIEATRTRERTKLTNTCVSIKLRFRLFDAVAIPTVLCGSISMPLTASDLNQLDATTSHASVFSWLGLCARCFV